MGRVLGIARRRVPQPARLNTNHSGSWAQRGIPPISNRDALAVTQVEDFDNFLEIFSTKGAGKRQQHGSKGVLVFRDPPEDDRVWVVFHWDEQGWQSFVSDPEFPPILKEAGHKGRPQSRAARRPVQLLTAPANGARPPD